MHRRPSVLIVDDHAIVGFALQELLEEMGCDAIGPVASGEQAIEQAEQHRPDLVLMDVELKGSIDGIEAAAEIRQRFGIPSVIFSGFGDSATKARAEQAGPLGFVDKMAPLLELATLLRKELGLHPGQAAQ